MADTPIFGNNKTCDFPGSGPVGRATSGWEVVYSVSHSAINAHVVTRDWDVDTALLLNLDDRGQRSMGANANVSYRFEKMSG